MAVGNYDPRECRAFLIHNRPLDKALMTLNRSVRMLSHGNHYPLQPLGARFLIPDPFLFWIGFQAPHKYKNPWLFASGRRGDINLRAAFMHMG
jgi:hypothetical protein